MLTLLCSVIGVWKIVKIKRICLSFDTRTISRREIETLIIQTVIIIMCNYIHLLYWTYLMHALWQCTLIFILRATLTFSAHTNCTNLWTVSFIQPYWKIIKYENTLQKSPHVLSVSFIIMCAVSGMFFNYSTFVCCAHK